MSGASIIALLYGNGVADVAFAFVGIVVVEPTADAHLHENILTLLDRHYLSLSSLLEEPLQTLNVLICIIFR